MMKALKWGSRWAVASPTYELYQQSMYRHEAPIRSTKDKPIYWKYEFWGTKKKENITFFPLSQHNYNYKSATLAMRQLHQTIVTVH